MNEHVAEKLNILICCWHDDKTKQHCLAVMRSLLHKVKRIYEKKMYFSTYKSHLNHVF